MTARKQVEIYTSPICGYCHAAKRLLNAKGVAFVERDVFAEAGARAEMLKRSEGRTTVPQIFIGGVGIGGSDDLHALDRAGRLDSMLAA